MAKIVEIKYVLCLYLFGRLDLSPTPSGEPPSPSGDPPPPSGSPPSGDPPPPPPCSSYND